MYSFIFDFWFLNSFFEFKKKIKKQKKYKMKLYFWNRHLVCHGIVEDLLLFILNFCFYFSFSFSNCPRHIKWPDHHIRFYFDLIYVIYFWDDKTVKKMKFSRGEVNSIGIYWLTSSFLYFCLRLLKNSAIPGNGEGVEDLRF